MNVGEKAPDFCLPDLNAQSVYLSNFFGRWVVLYFYPKDNTTTCTIEAVDFSKSLDDFDRLNAVVVGISTDSVHSHFTFAHKHNLKVFLLSDREAKTCKDYGVWRLKKLGGDEKFGVVSTTFIINPGGTIVYKWENVKVEKHAQEVRKKLIELQHKK